MPFADHILFAGGGTAGHLFPGLAVAERLRHELPRARVSFCGSGKPFEETAVRGASFAYFVLPCQAFPGRARDAWHFVAENLSGYYAARRLLHEEAVTLVVGLGGYASVPAVRAAARREIPYILLEQNAVPGRATRWLARRARAVCAAFDSIRDNFPNAPAVMLTGNPLRREFSQPMPTRELSRGTAGRPRRLIVLGGTSGAQVLNEQVPRALYKARLAGWEIVHQAGERRAAATAQLYRKLGLRATVLSFSDELPRLLRASDLAIARAGGTTLAELAACGVPAILVPYPRAAADHQRQNADHFAASGAAVVVDERELNGRLDNHVAAAVVELATDHPRRARMAAAMAVLARPHAARRVSRLIADLLRATVAV